MRESQKIRNTWKWSITVRERSWLLGSMMGTVLRFFHSHASGTRYMGSEFRFHVQHPSSEDVATAGDYVHYVFGMGDKQVYIYNKNGIQAVIPITIFVAP